MMTVNRSVACMYSEVPNLLPDFDLLNKNILSAGAQLVVCLLCMQAVPRLQKTVQSSTDSIRASCHC